MRSFGDASITDPRNPIGTFSYRHFVPIGNTPQSPLVTDTSIGCGREEQRPLYRNLQLDHGMALSRRHSYIHVGEVFSMEWQYAQRFWTPGTRNVRAPLEN